MRTLYLGGNGWTVRRIKVRDQEGALFSGIATVLIGDSPSAIAGITPELLQSDVVITAGELEATFQGEDLEAALAAGAAAAETAGTRYEVFERVLVSGPLDYGDYEKLVVRLTRLAGQP